MKWSRNSHKNKCNLLRHILSETMKFYEKLPKCLLCIFNMIQHSIDRLHHPNTKQLIINQILKIVSVSPLRCEVTASLLSVYLHAVFLLSLI